jgi:2-keto-4-pentenoate hydratase
MTHALSSVLIEAYQSGVNPHWSAHLAPQTLDESFKIQGEVARGLRAEVAGWKCGFQDNTDIAFGAPIFSVNQRISGGHWHLPSGAGVKVEVEIALRLGQDLPPRPHQPYRREEILAACASVFTGIELVASRFADVANVPFLARVADNFNQAGYVVSEGKMDFAALKLSTLRSRLWLNGTLAHDAVGGHQMGDPLIPVIAFATKQGDHLHRLKSGQFITTGTLNVPPLVSGRIEVVAEIEGLGECRLMIDV